MNATRRVDGVRRIAVLRPNAVGDFMFALPALAALRAAYPHAEIVLLGRRWHREFLQGRPGPWTEVLELPPIPGVGAPPDAACDAQAIEAFVDHLRQRRFDIALQLYGGGGHSNPFVRRLQARVTAGAAAPEAQRLDRHIDYVQWRNERLRLLEVVGLVGAEPVDLAPRLTLTREDTAELEAAQLPLDAGDPHEGDDGDGAAPWVVLQPGATDPRRRWPVERYAAVADRLAEQGARIAINGSADEAALCAELAQRMRAPALDLAGRLSLRALAALLARAALLVSNDTGPLHLAQALGTPTVGIYWVLNLLASGPLVAGPHRELFSLRTLCPVCGTDNTATRCAHDASFIADVSLDDAMALALQAFNEAQAARSPHLRRAA